MATVNVEELWSLVEGEEEGFSARDLAEFVFAEAVTDHHVAAMQRVLLQERLFFQFKDGTFFANSQEKIDQRRLEMEREQRKGSSARRGFRMAEGDLEPQTPPRPRRPRRKADRGPQELLPARSGFTGFSFCEGTAEEGRHPPADAVRFSPAGPVGGLA